MEAISKDNQTNCKAKSLRAFNVMKTLRSLTMEEVQQTTPFKVTYIANKKAKIVHMRELSNDSTDVE